MDNSSRAYQALVDAFSELPSVGEHMAQRLAQHCAQQPNKTAALQHALKEAEGLTMCSSCRAWSDQPECSMCQQPHTRQRPMLVLLNMAQRYVVISNKALVDRYELFVVHQCLSPVSGIGPNQLGLGLLKERVERAHIKQVLCALPNDTQGRLTAQFIADALGEGVEVNLLGEGVSLQQTTPITDLQRIEPRILNNAPS